MGDLEVGLERRVVLRDAHKLALLVDVNPSVNRQRHEIGKDELDACEPCRQDEQLNDDDLDGLQTERPS
jgi:hypothetical protein